MDKGENTMTIQQQAALQSMIDWLEHENELGRKPSKIEIAGEFDLHDMHYYIFKYKKSMLGKCVITSYSIHYTKLYD